MKREKIFALTPALSPRRGGANLHSDKILAFLFQSPVFGFSVSGKLQTKFVKFMLGAINSLPLPGGEGRGEASVT
jgi:hypothetical protein